MGEVLCTCFRSHSRAERLASDSAWVLGCTIVTRRPSAEAPRSAPRSSEIVGESGTKFMSPAAMRRVRGERGPESA